MTDKPTDAELIAELESEGVEFMRFRGGHRGERDIWTTTGSQRAMRIAAGMRKAIAKWGQPAQAGDAVARLEIESLKAQLHAAKQINAAQFGLLAASIPGSALRASHGQAPSGANENAELVTLIAECRDAFPIPAHGDPIENYWSAAIEDPANVPAYLQEIAKRKQADSVLEDAARVDYLHSTGSTIEMLPGEVDFYPMRFRVGGLRSAVSPNLREAIDIARKP